MDANQSKQQEEAPSKQNALNSKQQEEAPSKQSALNGLKVMSYMESSICKSQRHFVSTVAAILKEVSLLRNFSPVTVFAYGTMLLPVCGGG